MPHHFHRLGTLAVVLTMAVSGCAFQGVNSLPLPGTVGQGDDAVIYHIQLANVGMLERNSPVFIDDVVVGTIGAMRVDNWHAELEVSVKPDVIVPANAVAAVGQTSLLGSMHLALNPPAGQAPNGRLAPGTTLTMARSSTYPSTEQTLSALSVMINSGGVTQIGDIIHNAKDALHGKEGQIRDALTRLDTFLGTLDRQRDNITATIEGLDRLTATLASQNSTIAEALRDIPPALDVLVRERPRLTTALEKLGTFSDVATRLITDTRADLVTNLQNLAPTLSALSDLGPRLDDVLAYAALFPLNQNLVDRGVRGDYINLFSVIDLTVPRLKRTMFLGTRWGDANARLVPAPGDPYYLQYTYDPLNAPLAPPTADGPPPPVPPGPPPADVSDAGPLPSAPVPGGN